MLYGGGCFYRRAKCIKLHQFGLGLGGCNNEVTALLSEHYTEVPLYALLHLAKMLSAVYIWPNYLDTLGMIHVYTHVWDTI